MPLGVVSDDDFEKELNNSEVKLDDIGVPTIGRVDTIERGRGEGNNQVPDSMRKIIGETAITEGRGAALNLARQFGISEESVKNYTNGSVSSTDYNTGKKDLKDHLGIIRRNATRRAGRKLLKALDYITDDKLEEAPAGVLAGIAKSLSGVVRDLEPEVEKATGSDRPAQFIVFAPQVVKESHFEVIELKE